jgi:glutaconate CoA-transferase subunit B
VDKLDFITTAGFMEGGDSRERAGWPGKGPVAVITNLCILKPDPVTRELTVASLHPGVTREQVRAATGWPIRFANNIVETEAPKSDELVALRDLLARTKAAHQGQD